MNNDLEILSNFIKEKLGIDLNHNLYSLSRKLTPRFDELKLSPLSYISFLKSNKDEWEHVIDLLTINETYFFREKDQLNVFKELVTELSKTKSKIRIWSAACSTGEEPYSLAFTLSDFIDKDVEIEIVASDINKEVINTAENASYSKNSLSFRRASNIDLFNYFEEKDDTYVVKERYKNLVKFERFNLIDEDSWFFMKDFDFIFCRNVLIYFDDEAIEKIIENFYFSLSDQGALFLGHSDPYRSIFKEFEFIRTDSTIYFKKG